MRGWLVGLVIGLVVGAAAMYLVLRPPWGGGAGTTAPGDAGVVAVAPDAAPAKPKKRKRSGAPLRTGETATETERADDPDTEPVQLAAADRALEWRGDTVVLPPQRVDMGTNAEARALEDGEINATVGNQTAGVRECVVRGATGTDLRATITIKLVVDGAGRVTRSKLQAPRYLFEKGLLGCAQRELGRIRFPASGAPTLVTFPVNLG